ncbi:MAG: hypothetical protein QOI38_2291 [Sphingomonadales bacterium]|jgi:hypothetical protein|nr:hypothetical protein [Sphingomonadales bacterium]
MDWVGPGADWKEAAAYAPLVGADRSIFAWEWLRRDPHYREAAARAGRDARHNLADSARWGLHGFEDPGKAALDARPVWSADWHAHVLEAAARAPAAATDAFDLSRHSGLATLVDGAGRGQHLLLSDGLNAIRLDLVAGSVAEGPVELHYLLSGSASAKARLLALRRLLALDDSGGFSRTLHPREPSARRWILALRAHDALAVGAGHREIAAELLSDAAAGARWRVKAASVRSQVQRLVRSARTFARGGYRSFLD